MDSRKVFKLFFAGTLIITIVIMIMAVLGMRGDLYEIARFRGYDEEKRYCFGFLHPNSFSIIAFKILIMFFYAFYEKLHWWVIISTSTIVIPFVFLSGSITAIFVSLFVIVAVILFKIFKGNGFRRLTYILGNIGILATIGFSYAVMFLFDGKLEEIDGDYVAVGFWETINQRFFHGRLSIAYDAYKLYGLKPFGMKSDTVTAEIGYINTTLNQGYVFMCIYVLIVFILFYKLYKAKNSMGMIVVLAIVFYSFMESFIPYPNKNLIWLVGIGYLFTTVHGDAEKNEQYLQKK